MAVRELTQENFDDTITGNDIVLLDFWAPWCGPCRQFAPVFESLSESHPDVVFAKINTEEERELAGHFQIRSIPTLMVFRQQIIVFAQPGALPPAALASIVEKVKVLDMDDVRRQVAEQPAQQDGKA
jgi:thioredoxin 1